MAQVAQHCPASVEELIDLSIGGTEEVLFRQSVVLSAVLIRAGAKRETILGISVSWSECALVGYIRIGILGSCSVMWSAS